MFFLSCYGQRGPWERRAALAPGQHHLRAVKSETPGLGRGCTTTAPSAALGLEGRAQRMSILPCPTPLGDSRTKIAPRPSGLAELKISLNLRAS